MNSDIQQRSLYASLSQYGNVFPLKLKYENSDNFVKWTEENYSYSRYNPRKENNRYGLSLTSLNGETSHGPDLDSIPEYNREQGTDYREHDFKTITPAFRDDLRDLLSPFSKYLFRSHVLKLGPGGFFPPHRDQVSELKSFRLIIPLKNFNPPDVNFVVDGTTRTWTKGSVYFVDTVKEHLLFNSSWKDTYWIVLNVGLSYESFKIFTECVPH